LKTIMKTKSDHKDTPKDEHEQEMYALSCEYVDYKYNALEGRMLPKTEIKSFGRKVEE